MPAYFVSTYEPLTPQETQAVVHIITDVHCTLTGAPKLLVSVLFSQQVQLRKGAKMFISGNVRKGRDFAVYSKLLDQFQRRIGAVCDCPGEAIDVQLVEVPAEWLLEHGRVVPEPGQEAEWLRAIGEP